MKDIDELFNQFDLSYWAIAGTLLGAIRHEGMIPWDHENDIDIGINKAQEQFFLTLRRPLNDLGYDISSIFFGYKIFPKNGCSIVGRNFKFPFIDVFIFSENKEKTKFTYTWKKKRNFFFASELFPLKRHKFGEFFINCPNNPMPYLDAWYEDWQNEGWKYNTTTKEFDHFSLTKKDLAPAQPIGPLQNRVSLPIAN